MPFRLESTFTINQKGWWRPIALWMYLRELRHRSVGVDVRWERTSKGPIYHDFVVTLEGPQLSTARAARELRKWLESQGETEVPTEEGAEA